MKLRIVKEVKGKETFFYVEQERKGWFGKFYWTNVSGEILSANSFDPAPKRFKTEELAIQAIEDYKVSLTTSKEIVRELEL